MNIFFYGGTFDPPHIGHYNIVKHCLNLCEKFIIIPAKQSPLKIVKPEVNDNHRLQMLKILFKVFNEVKIDTVELNSDKGSYTYLTINYLKNKFPGCNLTMVIGYDQLLKLNKWKNYKQIISDVNILCFNRKINHKLEYDDKKINFVNSFNYDVSSKEVRIKIKNNKQLNYLDMLDPKIISYILENNLYDS